MENDENWVLPIKPVATPPDVAVAFAAEPPIVLAKPADAPGPSSREEIDRFLASHTNSRQLPDVLRRA